MEIKNVVNEVKNEYPKIKKVGKKKLSNSIPSKWIKVGIVSLETSMLMKNKVFAKGILRPEDIENGTIAGGAPIPRYEPISYSTCIITSMISLVIFIIIGLSILITKIRSKKVEKWIKILFVISIMAVIIPVILIIITNNISSNSNIN